jgi:phosphatidylglycerophosphatase A
MSLPRSDILAFRESFRKANLIQKLALCLSAWFGAGFFPRAPGTFGAFAALPLVILVSCQGNFFAAVFLLVFIPLAIWSSHVSAKLLDGDDPQVVVIDEVAGLLLTVFLFPFSWVVVAVGFLLFRVFDILKPFPIKSLEKHLPGGWGIVLDDLLAGIYGNLCLRCIMALLQ